MKTLILHVTNRCNFKCKHCFVMPGKDDLSLIDCRRLAIQVGKLAWLDIGGGEPFIRDDLANIISPFHAKVVTISTNSSQPVDQLREIRRRTNAELVISLSLDGLQPLHDRIRKKGNWDQVWETCKRIRRIGGIKIKINTVLTARNVQNIIPLMRAVRIRGVDFHSIILIRGKVRGQELPSLDVLDELVPEIMAIQESYDYGQGALRSWFLRHYHKRMWRASLETLRQSKQVVPCRAGRNHMVVWADGSVAPCELLPTVGNIKNQSWREIMGSGEMQIQRKRIRAGGCSCTHNCALFASILSSPVQIAKVLLT